MRRNQDFTNSKPGDVVIHSGAAMDSLPYPAKIKRLTTTMIVLEGRDGADGQRFNRKYGNSVGTDGWHSASIWIPEEGEVKQLVEQRKEKVTRAALIREIGELAAYGSLDRMPTEKLQSILAAMKTPTPEEQQVGIAGI